ncbi:MAG: hypothetical protein WAN93_07130, partial [Solirubrobacteraceae bacterium]
MFSALTTISPSDSGARFVGRAPDVKYHHGSVAEAEEAPDASTKIARKDAAVIVIVRRILLT